MSRLVSSRVLAAHSSPSLVSSRALAARAGTLISCRVLAAHGTAVPIYSCRVLAAEVVTQLYHDYFEAIS